MADPGGPWRNHRMIPPAPIPAARPERPPVEPEGIPEAYVVIGCIAVVGLLLLALVLGWI